MFKYKISVNKAIHTTMAVSKEKAINNTLFKIFGRNKLARDSADVFVVWTNEPNNKSNTLKPKKAPKLSVKEMLMYSKEAEFEKEKEEYQKYLNSKHVHPSQGSLF